VRGLPGAQLLPEERAVTGDPHPDAVPLPQLAGRGHPGHHPAPPRLPQVSAHLACASPGEPAVVPTAGD